MTNIRSIDIRSTIKALENAGICPSKFGYNPAAKHFTKKATLLKICREVGVSVVTFSFIN